MAKRGSPLRLLVTGTPGVGKTKLAEHIAAEHKFGLANVGEIIATNEFYEGLDAERECTIYDEDAVYEYLENLLSDDRDWVVDFHSTGAMALRRWFNLIIVLSADTDVLWERLEARKYPRAKIEENIECEILRVVEDEVRDYFEEDDDITPLFLESAEALRAQAESPALIICRLSNNTEEDFTNNVAAIAEWLAKRQRLAAAC